MNPEPEKQPGFPVSQIYSSNIDPYDIQLHAKSASLRTKDGRDIFIGNATLTYGSIVLSAEEIHYTHATRTAELYIYNKDNLPVRSATISLISDESQS